MNVCCAIYWQFLGVWQFLVVCYGPRSMLLPGKLECMVSIPLMPQSPVRDILSVVSVGQI